MKEYSNVTPMEEETECLKQVVLHPKAGKAWKIIPEEIRRSLLDLHGKRILVTELNRVDL